MKISILRPILILGMFVLPFAAGSNSLENGESQELAKIENSVKKIETDIE